MLLRGFPGPSQMLQKLQFWLRIRSPWLPTPRYSVTTKRNTSTNLFKPLPSPKDPIFDPKIQKIMKIRKIAQFPLFPCLGSYAGVIKCRKGGRRGCAMNRSWEKGERLGTDSASEKGLEMQIGKRERRGAPCCGLTPTQRCRRRPRTSPGRTASCLGPRTGPPPAQTSRLAQSKRHPWIVRHAIVGCAAFTNSLSAR